MLEQATSLKPRIITARPKIARWNIERQIRESLSQWCEIDATRIPLNTVVGSIATDFDMVDLMMDMEESFPVLQKGNLDLHIINLQEMTLEKLICFFERHFQ